MWKVVRRLTCSALSVQVSAPYISTDTTIAMYTALLVGIERVGLLKIGTLRRPKALEALAILLLSVKVMIIVFALYEFSGDLAT